MKESFTKMEEMNADFFKKMEETNRDSTLEIEKLKNTSHNLYTENKERKKEFKKMEEINTDSFKKMEGLINSLRKEFGASTLKL